MHPMSSNPRSALDTVCARPHRHAMPSPRRRYVRRPRRSRRPVYPFLLRQRRPRQALVQHARVRPRFALTLARLLSKFALMWVRRCVRRGRWKEEDVRWTGRAHVRMWDRYGGRRGRRRGRGRGWLGEHAKRRRRLRVVCAR